MPVQTSILQITAASEDSLNWYTYCSGKPVGYYDPSGHDEIVADSRFGGIGGGFEQAVDDFESLNPTNTKDISTKYGDGKFGRLDDGTIISVRPGSETGGPTLEIKVPGQRLIKIRY